MFTIIATSSQESFHINLKKVEGGLERNEREQKWIEVLKKKMEEGVEMDGGLDRRSGRDRVKANHKVEKHAQKDCVDGFPPCESFPADVNSVACFRKLFLSSLIMIIENFCVLYD